MKKLIPIVTFLLCSVLLFASCSKDKAKDDIEGLVTTTKKTEMFDRSEAKPESTNQDSALNKGAQKAADAAENAADGAKKIDEDIKQDLKNDDKMANR